MSLYFGGVIVGLSCKNLFNEKPRIHIRASSINFSQFSTGQKIADTSKIIEELKNKNKQTKKNKRKAEKGQGRTDWMGIKEIRCNLQKPTAFKFMSNRSLS